MKQRHHYCCDAVQSLYFLPINMFALISFLYQINYKPFKKRIRGKINKKFRHLHALHALWDSQRLYLRNYVDIGRYGSHSYDDKIRKLYESQDHDSIQKNHLSYDWIEKSGCFTFSTLFCFKFWIVSIQNELPFEFHEWTLISPRPALVRVHTQTTGTVSIMIPIHSQIILYSQFVYLSADTLFFVTWEWIENDFYFASNFESSSTFELAIRVAWYNQTHWTTTSQNLWYDDDRNIRLRQIWLCFRCFASLRLKFNWNVNGTHNNCNNSFYLIHWDNRAVLLNHTIEIGGFVHILYAFYEPFCGISRHFVAFNQKSRESRHQNKRIGLSCKINVRNWHLYTFW